MDLGLQNKAALVAAASKGLGRAVAEELAREGARVAICSRNETLIEQVAGEIAGATGGEVLGLRADVSRTEDVEKLVSEVAGRFGTIDILVTNAGGPPPGTFDTLENSAWTDAFHLNLLSVVDLCRAAIPYMKANRWGRIINVTSISVKQPVVGLLLSNSLRAGVVGLAKTLSKELGPDNILVNNVCPGFTRTERVDQLANATAERTGVSREDVFRDWESTIPLGRIGTTAEFAALVAFLASERASYITGATIPIDGGAVQGLM